MLLTQNTNSLSLRALTVDCLKGEKCLFSSNIYFAFLFRGQSIYIFYDKGTNICKKRKGYCTLIVHRKVQIEINFI